MIKLRTTIKIKSILKPTKAQFYSEIIEEDVLDISLPLLALNRNRGSLYAPTLTIINKRLQTKTKNTLTELVNRLLCFEYEEVQSDKDIKLSEINKLGLKIDIIGSFKNKV